MTRKLAPGWLKRIEEAQQETDTLIARNRYQRLRALQWCRSCAVEQGQLHVPGCTVERCPVCLEGQAITCGCTDPEAVLQ